MAAKAHNVPTRNLFKFDSLFYSLNAAYPGDGTVPWKMLTDNLALSQIKWNEPDLQIGVFKVRLDPGRKIQSKTVCLNRKLPANKRQTPEMTLPQSYFALKREAY